VCYSNFIRKRHLFPRYSLKTASKLIHKLRGNDCSNYAPRQTHSPPDKSMTEKEHHIFVPTASVRCSIIPRLCMVVEDVETIPKGANHFSIQHIVFPVGENADFWPLSKNNTDRLPLCVTCW